MTSWQNLEEALAYGRELLRGEQVRLREVRDGDYPQLVEWWSDPEVAVLQAGWVRPVPAGATTEMMRSWSANSGNDAGFAVERLEDDALLGQATLFGVGKDRCATLAIVLGPAYWSSGYGSDAVRVLVRYGFGEMALHRIELDVFAFNTRAIAAYQRVGFVLEGRRRQAIFHDGQWHDDVQMGLLIDDWVAARS